MGQGQGKEALARALGGVLLAFAASAALAQLNPFSIVGRAVTAAFDVRTGAEVAADAEIGAGASKRLLDDKKAEWAGVAVLVFAQHVVLAGAVKSEAVKKRVEELAQQKVRGIKGVKSLKSHLRIVPKK